MLPKRHNSLTRLFRDTFLALQLIYSTAGVQKCGRVLAPRDQKLNWNARTGFAATLQCHLVYNFK